MYAGFRVGSWLVEPSLNTLYHNGMTVRLAPRVMEVLVCLAQHAGETLAKEDLFQKVWPNTFVTDDALKRCIVTLRRVFEDHAREPHVIQTVAKRGYRLIAAVELIDGRGHVSTGRLAAVDMARGSSKQWMKLLTIGCLALLVLVILLTIVNVGGIPISLRFIP